MPDSAEAIVAVPSPAVEDIAAETGMPAHSRRLSDKVLAAFNHAYAVGEVDVAVKLREILAKLEQERIMTHSARRPTSMALSQADLWVEFVEARNDYRAACADPALDGAAQAQTLERMKAAYQRWSDC